ncbi:rhomboid family intramembrane serine protease [Corynebacterium sp. ES2715-CONJ3]|uniref:rhomboid family intramembrane serine protease n=1 Tax=Corynebacterium sp. ES2715-CONJ3 TaxID=2974028 RepID=UPI00216A9BAE|nr:rhomboid family intramembrane serine protease [Corynebacterium sp. ES2715-CONJ3]MCS4492207.1 rhomboid family intramembrane serine protease [Corynebacterium sp. ES2715-CONJ3]
MVNIVKNYYRQAPVSAALVALMIVLWVLTAVESLSITNNLKFSSLADHLVFYGPKPNPFSGITASLMHTSISHLALNLVLVVLMGREIERAVGPRKYLGVFIAAALSSAACVALFDPYSAVAGASGFVYALMVLLVGLNASRRLDLRAPLTLLLVNFGFSFLIPGISLMGHMGGALAGVALLPLVLKPKRTTDWIVIGATGLIAGAVIIYASGI